MLAEFRLARELQLPAAMAKTNKIARYVKGPRELETPNRAPHAKPTALYLLALRSHHAAAQSPLPRRKLVITIDTGNAVDRLPKPVKITHA